MASKWRNVAWSDVAGIRRSRLTRFAPLPLRQQPAANAARHIARPEGSEERKRGAEAGSRRIISGSILFETYPRCALQSETQVQWLLRSASLRDSILIFDRPICLNVDLWGREEKWGGEKSTVQRVRACLGARLFRSIEISSVNFFPSRDVERNREIICQSSDEIYSVCT